jgi:hypothetical protein
VKGNVAYVLRDRAGCRTGRRTRGSTVAAFSACALRVALDHVPSMTGGSLAAKLARIAPPRGLDRG